MNVVEKYGGTSVGTIAQIKAVAAHAAKLKAQGDQVVIVASAMGKTTNKLIAMAKQRKLVNMSMSGSWIPCFPPVSREPSPCLQWPLMRWAYRRYP